MIRNPNESERCVAGGVAGGVAAGLALLVLAIVEAGTVWPVLKFASLPWFGTRVLESGFDVLPVLIGLAVHFAVSIGWGVAFAVLAYGLSHWLTLAASVGWGLLAFLVMNGVVLPVLGWSALGRSAPMGVAFLFHLVFGLVIGVVFLPFQRPKPVVLPHYASRFG